MEFLGRFHWLIDTGRKSLEVPLQLWDSKLLTWLGPMGPRKNSGYLQPISLAEPPSSEYM